MTYEEKYRPGRKGVYSESMRKPLTPLSAMFVILILTLSVKAGQKFDVKIIDRRDSQTGYSYVVPAHSTSVSNTSVDCSAGSGNVSCSGSTTTQGSSTPPHRIAYDVTGATLSLQLPDGRTTVVNCVSKYKMRGDYINRRSCRIPYITDLQAEFDGKNVKLRWPVSIDGKKFDSETYKILAVLDK